MTPHELEPYQARWELVRVYLRDDVFGKAAQELMGLQDMVEKAARRAGE